MFGSASICSGLAEKGRGMMRVVRGLCLVVALVFGWRGVAVAATAYYPANDALATWVFEDLWPSKGDYDFNDLVVKYRLKATNIGDDVELEIVGRVQARGAGVHSGFAIGLPVAAASVRSATLGCADEPKEVEVGQTLATFVVFEDAFTFLAAASPGCSFYNTKAECNDPGQEFKLKATLATTLSLADVTAGVNPFIFRSGDGNRGHEVHLPGYQPTDKATVELFGTADDATAIDGSHQPTGNYYLTVDNLPWALDIPVDWQWPKERVGILSAYPAFASWAMNAGLRELEWFNNNPQANTPVAGATWSGSLSTNGVCVGAADILALSRPVYDPSTVELWATFDRDFDNPPTVYLNTTELELVDGFINPPTMDPEERWSTGYDESFDVGDDQLPYGWEDFLFGDASVSGGGGAVILSAHTPSGEGAAPAQAGRMFIRPTTTASGDAFVELHVALSELGLGNGGLADFNIALSWLVDEETYNTLSFFWAAARDDQSVLHYARMIEYESQGLYFDTAPLAAGSSHTIRIRLAGSTATTLVDGAELASIDLGSGRCAGFSVAVHTRNEYVEDTFGQASVRVSWQDVSTNLLFLPDYTFTASPLRYQGRDYQATELGPGAMFLSPISGMTIVTDEGSAGVFDGQSDISVALLHNTVDDSFSTLYTSFSYGELIAILPEEYEIDLWIPNLLLAVGEGGAYEWSMSALGELSWTGYPMTALGGASYALAAQGSFIDSGFYFMDENGFYYWGDPPDAEQTGTSEDDALTSPITFQGGAP